MFACLSFMALMNASAQFDTARLRERSPEKGSIASSNPFKPDTLELREAEIRPFKDYASFKQAFITLEHHPGQKDSLAIKEQLIRKQLDLGITPEMDAQSNFNNNYVQSLIRPQGLIFFSSEPGKGLPVIPLIRKILGREKKVKSEE